MKKNTLDQLLIAFFKELSLCVKCNANSLTTVSSFLNHHSTYVFSLQPLKCSQFSSYFHQAKWVEYSINLSPRTQ